MNTCNLICSVSSFPVHSAMTKRRHGSGGNSNRNKKISRSLSVDNVNSGLLADGSSHTQPDLSNYSSSQPPAVVNMIHDTEPDLDPVQDRMQCARYAKRVLYTISLKSMLYNAAFARMFSMDLVWILTNPCCLLYTSSRR